MTLRSRVFWVVYRTACKLYTWFPIFGRLRGSVAIIRRDNRIVVIERNDGYGLGFPGGLAGFRESPEAAVRREVREETGLTVLTVEFKFHFVHPHPFPAETYVFEATAEGDLRSSWEGTARIVSLAELEERVVPQQRKIVEYLQGKP